ncbi:MAG: T9SS type A sorting domain-containing protein [Bacteroidales bacterium]|jgi:hypothetical protein|nr:T9SS type A sorting domain-containing protein [Bacteroidales bacterium]
MKKTFTLLLVFPFFTFGFAQNLPNSGFEIWSNATTPSSWTTSYSGTVGGMIPLSFSFGTRTVDAHSGTYALKISPSFISFGNVTLPAFVQLGSVGTFNLDAATLTALANLDFENIDISQLAALQTLISKGIPMNDSPSELKFWYKFLPDSADMATVNVITTKWNSTLNMPEVVATGTTTIENLTTQYTEMNVLMSLEGPSSLCDTIRVIFSVGGLNSSAASELFIDDISMIFNTWGVENNTISNLKLYPNPTSDFATISLMDYSSHFDVEVFDNCGKLVHKNFNITDIYTFSTHEFSSGIYLVKVLQNGNISTSKLVVE